VTPAIVAIDSRAAAAYGITGGLPVAAVVILPGGAVVRVRADGGLDEIAPGGHPRGGIACDPTASRSAA
jgi:hypothetical protein